MYDLSVVIPARNEEFLNQTIQSVLQNRRGRTEVIVVLDGQWPLEAIQDHERVTIIYHPRSIGQRAAINDGVRVAQGWYVMKLDAHCAVSEGFDVILMEDIQPGWTISPAMYNLHAFNWVCPACGFYKYQGRSKPCPKCGGEMDRDILWRPRRSTYNTAMRFDRDMVFGYWGTYKARQEGDLVETMSIVGACWMLERERYLELNMCDEGHGGWGQQGTEVACKSWLSGGRLIVDKRCWFAHMFRTQGGDFGFPYSLTKGQTDKARSYSRWLWNSASPFELPRWEKAIHPLAWLIERFAPVPGWGDVEKILQTGGLSKGILYYSDNDLDESILKACQAQLLRAGLPIVSVTLKPMDFGTNLVVEGEPGPATMFRQILAGLEALDTDVVFFAEHDVLYDPGHFAFVPTKGDRFYYDQNVWRVRKKDGHALFYYSNHTSQLCARRDLLLEHYRRRVELVEERGFSRKMGYEPGTHNRPERVDDHTHETWMAPVPSIDIRHDRNLTESRWSKDQFRNQQFTKGWTEAEEVPGWGRTGGCMEEFLDGLSE